LSPSVKLDSLSCSFTWSIHILFHWFSMKDGIVFFFNFDRVLTYFFLSKFMRNLHQIPNWKIINDLDDISLVVMQATWTDYKLFSKGKISVYCLLLHLYFINIFCELKYRCMCIKNAAFERNKSCLIRNTGSQISEMMLNKEKALKVDDNALKFKYLLYVGNEWFICIIFWTGYKIISTAL